MVHTLYVIDYGKTIESDQDAEDDSNFHEDVGYIPRDERLTCKHINGHAGYVVREMLLKAMRKSIDENDIGELSSFKYWCDLLKQTSTYDSNTFYCSCTDKIYTIQELIDLDILDESIKEIIPDEC